MSNSEFMPFHMAHPRPYRYDVEQQSEQELSVIKSYYPEAAMLIQTHVERECDKMEYEGSMMYDEYPDKTMVEHLSQKIIQQLERELESQTLDMDDSMMGMNGQCISDQFFDVNNQPMQMQQWGEDGFDRFGGDLRRRHDRRRGCRNPWECQDLTRVLLLNEIFRRRCRNGRCRRFF